MITIERASSEHRALWTSFLARHPSLHHAFSWEWRDILARSFSHTPCYLIARHPNGNGEEVRGVLPCFFFKSILFGRSLISLPYLNAGGIAAEDPDVFTALLRRAESEAEKIGAKYIELRFRDAQPLLGSCSLRTHKVAMSLPLADDAESVFSRFPAKLRSQIRRPMKDGVTAALHGDDSAALHAFYEVFSENMRDLGTPVYPRLLFEQVMRSFAGRCRLILVSLKDTALAGGITIGHGERTEMVWASARREYNSLSPNMLLYWEAIRAACNDGYRIFDFGRSTPGSGSHHFKEQWGAEPTALHWYYPQSRVVPDVNPRSSKFELFVRGWKQLPLRAANILGPRISRHLP